MSRAMPVNTLGGSKCVAMGVAHSSTIVQWNGHPWAKRAASSSQSSLQERNDHKSCVLTRERIVFAEVVSSGAPRVHRILAAAPIADITSHADPSLY